MNIRELMNLKSIEQNSVSLCLLSDVKMAGQIFPKLEDVLGCSDLKYIRNKKKMTWSRQN